MKIKTALVLFVISFCTAVSQSKKESKFLSDKRFESHRWEKSKDFPSYFKIKKGQKMSKSDFELWSKENFTPIKGSELKLKSSLVDELGISHYTYLAQYKGFLIEGILLKVHEKSGEIESINAQMFSINKINTNIEISEVDAFQKAIKLFKSTKFEWQDIDNPKPSPKAQLIIKSVNNNLEGSDFRLCYKFDIYSLEPLKREFVYIDANSGKVIFRENKICHMDYTATATTKYSGTQSIKTNLLNGNYILKETDRGGGIQTFDMRSGTSYSSAVNFTDADNVWNHTNTAQDEVARDAHFGAEKTYDFYFTKFGRNSYDNAGAPINSYVHYDNAYNNAFWDGTRMTYGDGDGSYFTPLVSPDVVGHEITHAVTQHSADLVYAGESGALNESFSDIFGKAVEIFAIPTTTSWLIGDKITPNGQGIRSMNNPNIHGDPDTYGGLNWFSSGDVHVNSGVQNHWFYLLVNGGSGTNDLGNAYAISGIGIDKAARIAYRNLTVYLTPNATYSDARFYAIRAAEDLYGACSAEVIATANAWYAVGVGSLPNFTVDALFTADKNYSCSSPATIQFINNSANATQFFWSFGDGTTSTLTSPIKTYSNTGTYTVKLRARGSASCGVNVDSLTQTNYIKVDNAGSPVAASCSPATLNPSSLVGISKVVLNTIDKSSAFSNEGYKDFTCSNLTTLLKGKKYEIQITTNAITLENTVAWIDYNNNGIFTTNEIIYSGQGKGTQKAEFLIPNISITGIPLRLRIGSASSLNAPPDGCSSVNSGQYEDYSVVINNTTATSPIADFISDTRQVVPGGSVRFSDFSQNFPTGWSWTFTGGNPNTSTSANPTITYSVDGVYAVLLKASNSIGNNTVVKTGYITVSNSFVMCSSVSGTTASNGNVFDSGGSGGNYKDNENCSFLINPPCASALIIKFKTFSTESGYDYLKIYNGTSTSAPLVFNRSGNLRPDSLSLSSGKAYIEFKTDGSVVSTGYELEFYTRGSSGNPISNFLISNTNPGINEATILTNTSSNAGFQSIWDLGDGRRYSAQNSTATYTTSGIKNIKLRVSNCLFSDSITKQITVQQPGRIVIFPTILSAIVAAGDSTIRSFTVSNAGVGSISYEAINPQTKYDSTSSVTYTTTAATTTHVFGKISNQASMVSINITINGDYDSSVEYASLYVNNNFIAIVTDNDVSNGTDISQVFTLPGSYLSTGRLEVRLANSSEVNTNIGGSDRHQVRVISNGVENWVYINSNGINSVQSSTSQPVELKFKSSLSFPKGVYTYPLRVTSTDLLKPVSTVMCNMTVLGNPIANFTSNVQIVTVGGYVNFSDISLNTPTGWNWTFSGGNPATSTQKNPIVQYNSLGTYNVSLSVSNADGTNQTTKSGYIQVSDLSYMCNVSTVTSSNGTLYDSGGPNGNYGANQYCTLLIKPTCSGVLNLSFQSFDLEYYGDYLYVYDGENGSSPNIFYGTGNAIPQTLTAYSGKMYIVFVSNSSIQNSGFQATWAATPPTSAPIVDFYISNATPITGENVYFSSYVLNSPSSYLWTFEPGKTSILQNPNYVFTTSGIKNITLTASNCVGSSSIAKAVTVAGVSITQLSPNPVNTGSTLYIYGNGLSTTNSIYYRNTSGGVSSTYFNAYSGYLYGNVPYDIVTAPLTLSGQYGILISPVLTINGASSTSFMCMPNAINSGGLTPNNTPQSVVVSANNGYYWTFTGVANTTYEFSSCGASEDTYLRIYNSSGSLVASNDDSGPLCGSTAASMQFSPTNSGTYYVLFTRYSCSSLSFNSTLYYNVFVVVPPTISGISPNPVCQNSYFNINGTSFNSVQNVIYKTLYGTNYASFSKYSTYLQLYSPSDMISAPLTLTGSFGNVITPTVSITGGSPYFLCVNCSENRGSISPTSTTQTVSVTGGNAYYWTFTGIANSTYEFSTCGTGSESTEMYIYDSYGSNFASNSGYGPLCSTNRASLRFTANNTGVYYVYVSKYYCSRLVNALILSYNTYVYPPPSISGISPNPICQNSYFNINGTNFDGVSNIIYKTLNGTNTVSFYRYSTYLELYAPSNMISAPLTLTGSFGNVVTPIVSITGASPYFLCVSCSENRGSISPTSTTQSASVNGGNAYYWTFTGISNTTYEFSTCVAGSESTEMIVYDSYGNYVTGNSGYGPKCSTNRASLRFTANYTSVYYVYVSRYYCSRLANALTLSYNTYVYPPPSVSSVSPNPVCQNSYFNINGTNFDGVSNIIYKTLNGTNTVSFYRYSTYLEVYLPSNMISAPLTLTGSFGNVVTPIVSITGASPYFLCVSCSENRGSISPTSTTQSASVNGGNAYYWTFTGISNTTYEFSTCGAGSENTEMYIYDSYGSNFASNSGYGPKCSTNRASLRFTANYTSVYYVYVSRYYCSRLANALTLSYNTYVYPPPSVTSISPNPVCANSYFNINGTNFDGVSNIIYKTLNGTNSVGFSNYITYLQVYKPSDIITAPLTLTGGFGNMITPILSISGDSPSFICAPCSQNNGRLVPSSVQQSITVSSGNAYYWTFTGIANTTYEFSTCGAFEDTYLRIYNSTGIPVASNDDNGPLCNSGAASLQFTPTYTSTYYVLFSKYSCSSLSNNSTLYYNTSGISQPLPTPTVTSISPNPTSRNSTVYIYGTDLNQVTELRYKNSSGGVSVDYPTSYSFYIPFVLPSNIITGTLTLTGTFGSVQTPELVITATGFMCMQNAINLGGLAPLSTTQNIGLNAGNGYYWTFTGLNTISYLFSSCGTSEDTYLRIYDQYGIEIVSNNDNGSSCSTSSAASLTFVPIVNGTYYVLYTHNYCSALTNNSTFYYSYLGNTPTPAPTPSSPISQYLCMPTAVNAGVIYPLASLQTVTGTRGNGHYWSFNGVGQRIYEFSTCNSTENTILMIYNSQGKVVEYNDNIGATVCMSNPNSSKIRYVCTITGVYYLSLTNNSCKSLSTDVKLVYHTPATNAINDTDYNANTFELYPIPTEDVLHIKKTETNGNVTVIAYNSIGSTVFKTTINCNGSLEYDLNVENWSKGVYKLVLNHKDKIEHKTFIVR